MMPVCVPSAQEEGSGWGVTAPAPPAKRPLILGRPGQLPARNGAEVRCECGVGVF